MLETESGSGHKTTSRPPSVGEMMPDFTLASNKAKFIRISDYRGRRNLVLAFCGRGDSDAIREFLLQASQDRSQFADEDAEVLAVVRGAEDLPQYFWNLSFPFLEDAEGHAHYLAGLRHPDAFSTPVVYVVDRFGEIRHIFHPNETSNAAIAAILEWVRYINLECPE